MSPASIPVDLSKQYGPDAAVVALSLDSTSTPPSLLARVKDQLVATMPLALQANSSSADLEAAFVPSNVAVVVNALSPAGVDIVIGDGHGLVLAIATPPKPDAPEAQAPVTQSGELVFVIPDRPIPGGRQWRAQVDLGAATATPADGAYDAGTATLHIVDPASFAALLAKPGTNGCVLVDSPATSPGMLHREVFEDNGQGGPTGPLLGWYELPDAAPPSAPIPAPIPAPVLVPPAPSPAPTIGRIVHFTMPAEISKRAAGQVRPAMIVRVWDSSPTDGSVNLQVFTDCTNDCDGGPFDQELASGMLWRTSVHYDPAGAPGTWCYPPRV